MEYARWQGGRFKANFPSPSKPIGFHDRPIKISYFYYFAARLTLYSQQISKESRKRCSDISKAFFDAIQSVQVRTTSGRKALSLKLQLRWRLDFEQELD
ncbi:hypothetical protein [Undibacterium sp. Ren11W]|uniref:hypothetical protein n=1 Tax=Undibacterium sp. Ren11W TaxID=3413045 RepID=UPI003BF257A2